MDIGLEYFKQPKHIRLGGVGGTAAFEVDII